MMRCLLPTFVRRIRAVAALIVLGASAFVAAPPVQAQNAALTAPGNARNFPPAAVRGALVITSSVTAEINGKPYRVAPGIRLFNPQNALVMLHTVIGQSFVVNYVIEPSTGMLHTAWILSKHEASLPRAGGTDQRNFRFESEVGEHR